MPRFELVTDLTPLGDQPAAIRELTEGLAAGRRFQTLLGATGTGKTFTIGHVIRNYGRPTLVMSHNKTLAAQLYGELKQLFPNNAVEYFISYYDYYQPEAYIPATDTYIEKDASINEDIDRLRLRTTSSLIEREDVIVVASVSAIYGLGSPREYRELMVVLEKGQRAPREQILEELVRIQYRRDDIGFEAGKFRVRGDVIEVFPAYEEQAVRIELWGDEVERIAKFDPMRGTTIQTLERAAIYPAKHFVTTRPTIEAAIKDIRTELDERLAILRAEGRMLEAHKLETRTRFDIEMMQEMGYCAGIENYSRHLTGRAAGERPACLLDYFPEDFLLVIDESHVTIPQIGGMYAGDRSRKETLVEHGYRLPSALDNRPLHFEEFERFARRAIFVSATPADDLLEEIRAREAVGEKVLVTTLTKRMAEDLSEYLNDVGVRVRYMHSDIDSIERMEILRGLRTDEFDVLVGINLLREGLDLPEVSLVAVLDADKEGFLRSETSLIQTAGRAARNVNGRVILYADRVTDSMRRMMEETDRRRAIQRAHNEKHGIEPRTVLKTREQILMSTSVADSRGGGSTRVRAVRERVAGLAGEIEREELARSLEAEMKAAAERLDFHAAALLRDQLFELRGDDPRRRAATTLRQRIGLDEA